MNHYEILINIRDYLIENNGRFEDIKMLDSLLSVMEKQPHVFIVSDNMCLALQRYFLEDAGYISHEHHPDVHKFTNQLDEYIKKYVIPTK